jgi:hypothetical protein
MLSSEDEYVPGYDKKKPMSLQVLGPVPEQINGARSLRWFESNAGKTKNGHSVTLMLRYRKLKMLLGGDLNIPSEQYMLEHYTKLDLKTAKPEAIAKRARKQFEAEVAKACHHGSADFSISWLQSVNAIATVISSGDEEPHAHPRPDALGAFGKYGRGERPLIFSTELARSSKESIKDPQALRSRINELVQQRASAETTAAREAADARLRKALAQLERSIATYGMITVRSDGDRVVIAQKLERPRPNGDKWDYYPLERDDAGELQYRSKHDAH